MTGTIPVCESVIQIQSFVRKCLCSTLRTSKTVERILRQNCNVLIIRKLVISPWNLITNHTWIDFVKVKSRHWSGRYGKVIFYLNDDEHRDIHCQGTVKWLSRFNFTTRAHYTVTIFGKMIWLVQNHPEFCLIITRYYA